MQSGASVGFRPYDEFVRCVNRAILFLGLVTCLGQTTTLAQLHRPSSGEPAYENHNQIDPKPIRLRRLQGTVKDQNGILVPGVAIYLFSSEHHAFLSSAKSDGQGRFILQEIKDGEYRVVAKLDGFCAANIPVAIKSTTPVRSELLVNLRVGGIDTCSFGELRHR